MYSSVCWGVVASLWLVACSSPRDFGDQSTDAVAKQTVSIAWLKSLYRGYPVAIDRQIQIRGAITANDLYGGLRHRLYVQDATGGVELKLYGDRLHARYPVGRVVRVVCRGLVLGDYGGMVSLGGASDDGTYENGFIAENEQPQHLISTDSMVDLRPDTLHIGQLQYDNTQCYVAFDSVQFIDREVDSTWCARDVPTSRHLIDRSGDTLIVRTLPTAEFATWLLPHGSGYIEGVLERFGSIYQLRVIQPHRAVMDRARFEIE